MASFFSKTKKGKDSKQKNQEKKEDEEDLEKKVKKEVEKIIEECDKETRELAKQDNTLEMHELGIAFLKEKNQTRSRETFSEFIARTKNKK